MNLNLDTLKSEILEDLEQGGFVVFHGYSRVADNQPVVYWDGDRYPDHRAFLQVAKQAGASLIVFHHREFSASHVDEAIERLEECDLPSDDHRRFERRLRDLRAYDGFTCSLEVSFDHEGRTYVYDLRAEWYDEFMDLLDEIDASLPDDEDEDEGPVGGYFSRN